jgi:hypothetical protein
LSLCFNWAPRHEGVLGEWRISPTHSLASALDGGEWSASRPDRFTPRERAPGTHSIGGWVGSRVVLDAVVKRKIPSPHRESNPITPIVQPVAQLYTDWAIAALCNKEFLRKMNATEIFLSYLYKFSLLLVFHKEMQVSSSESSCSNVSVCLSPVIAFESFDAFSWKHVVRGHPTLYFPVIVVPIWRPREILLGVIFRYFNKISSDVGCLP